MLYLYDRKPAESIVRQRYEIKNAVKFFKSKGIQTKIISGLQELYQKTSDDIESIFIPYALFRDDLISLVSYCNSAHIPVITMRIYPNQLPNSTYSTITRDLNACMQKILSYFIYNTSKTPKVAYFGVTPNTLVDIDKINAFYSLYSEMKPDDVYFNESSFIDCFNAFYDRRNEYDAIIFANSYIAIAFNEIMMKRDKACLDKLLTVSFLDSTLSHLCYTDLTLMLYSDNSLLEAAAEIFKIIHKRKNITAMNVFLENHLMIGDSTHRLPAPDDKTAFDLVHQYYMSSRKAYFSSYKTNTISYDEDEYLRHICNIENLFNSCDNIDLIIILMLLKKSKNIDISKTLFLSPQTIKYRTKSMFNLLKTKNKVEFIEIMHRYIDLEKLEKYIKDKGYEKNILCFS